MSSCQNLVSSALYQPPSLPSSDNSSPFAGLRWMRASDYDSKTSRKYNNLFRSTFNSTQQTDIELCIEWEQHAFSALRRVVGQASYFHTRVFGIDYILEPYLNTYVSLSHKDATMATLPSSTNTVDIQHVFFGGHANTIKQWQQHTISGPMKARRSFRKSFVLRLVTRRAAKNANAKNRPPPISFSLCYWHLRLWRRHNDYVMRVYI